MNPVAPYPFAILQLALRVIPRRAMAGKVWGGYLVESESSKDSASGEGDFLDFHASPFALRRAARALSQ